MTIEFQPDHNLPRIYRPTPDQLLTLGQTGDMEWPLFVHARVINPDQLKLFLTGFAFAEPKMESLDSYLRVLNENEINRCQLGQMEPLFMDHNLDLQVIKILDRRFRWFQG